MKRQTRLLVLAALLTVVAVACTSSAAAKPIRLYHPDTAPKYKLQIVKRVVRHAEHVQAFFETHPQQARSRAGRAALWRHGRILRAALKAVKEIRRELWLTLPDTNDWTNAVYIAQRPYPGTADRLFRISDHEGGRGEWVWWGGSCSDPPCPWQGYHIGADPWGNDTVGGPVQFRYSTFAPYWRGMIKDLRRRGFKLPDLGWARPKVKYMARTGYGPWLSPLGQALTAAYMHYYGKQARHWDF